MDRRAFIQTSALTVGGLLVTVSGLDAFAEADSFKPNAWLRIPTQGPITFICDRAEMGQGVYTSLAMLVAEELGVDPVSMRIEFAPADRVYDNPKLNMQVTGGSTSVAAAWEPLRRAGATARHVLVAAAARKWGVDAKSCRAENGRVISGGKSATFGELASAAAKERAPKEPTLKARADFKLIGKSHRRLDAPAKVTGRAGFGIDAEVADMRVAVVKRCPVIGGRTGKFDPNSIAGFSGVEKVVSLTHGVAIIAGKYWQARKAAEALVIEWDLRDAKKVSSDALAAEFLKDAEAERKKLVKKLGATGKGPRAIDAEYEVPYMAHAAMEPGCCVAHVTKERVDVWAPTQAPGLAQQLVAAMTDRPHAEVFIHTTFLGGGFGRRLYQDFVVEAVQIAQQFPHPVKVQWSREDDMRHDFYRPMTTHALTGILADDGSVSYAHAIVGQSLLQFTIPDWLPAMLPAWLPNGVKNVAGSAAATLVGFSDDATSTEGAADTPYAFTKKEISHVRKDPGVPVGFWRSVGHSYTGFVVEGFVDELAHAAGKDPVEFRKSLLKDAPRQRRVLELAAEKAGWGRPLPAGVFRGVAQHSSFGSHCAQVLEVAVDAAGTNFTVKRVVCAVDCGTVVNPDGVVAQIESGIVFGLSAALFGAITFKDGAVEQSNFHDFPVARLTDVPQIEVHIVESDANPTGVGEPGVPPVAPAIANALFAATKKRLRRLPLKLT